MRPAVLLFLMPLSLRHAHGQFSTHMFEGRRFETIVPRQSWMQLPLLVALHPGGMNGALFCGMLGTHSFTRRFYTVCPNGLNGTWNVVAENGHVDDIGYLYRFVDHMYTVHSATLLPKVVLYGQSNGGALVNRVMVESTDRRIVAAVTDACQLHTVQFHEGSFWAGGRNNLYELPQPTLVRRKLLQLTGGMDTVVPAGGGDSNIEGLHGAPLHFLSWWKSANAFARAFGVDTVPQPPFDLFMAPMVVFEEGYVVAINDEEAGHLVLGPRGNESAAYGRAADRIDLWLRRFVHA